MAEIGPVTPVWLTPGQVATALAVNVRTVARWTETGRLPCVWTPGGQRRYRADVISELVVNGVPPPPSIPPGSDRSTWPRDARGLWIKVDTQDDTAAAS